ncbi:MAG: CoA-binding protein [Chloroflexi bacterium]|nr:CoA-binding protein [Chloroflexota bacterium]
MSTHPLEEILHPQSIAVVGASAGIVARGFDWVSYLSESGFKGKIYPVNPKYAEIRGLKAYPSLREVPGPVDYVISVAPASAVLNILEDSAPKGVKCVHLFTARLSETGRPEAAELERAILRQAKKLGIRLIGPNCMGVYYPKEGISFNENFPRQSGSAGLAAQSGSVSNEAIRLAAQRGVYFSKAISYGNALDFNECDFLEYFAQDAETKLILMYVEGVRDGKRFFSSLSQAAATKPVIVLKGGRGESGTRATASHTASLAGSMKIWNTMVTQAGAVSAESLNELIDLAAAFYFLPPIKGLRVGVAGGAGGTTVMSADHCEEAGLDVIPLPAEIREELKAKGNPIWDWIGNPADGSIRATDDFTAGDILQMMANNQNFDLLITHINEPHHRSQGQEISAETHLKQYKLEMRTQKPLLAVIPDKPAGINDDDERIREVMSATRTKLLETSIPVYPTIERAASAARKLVEYYRRKK